MFRQVLALLAIGLVVSSDALGSRTGAPGAPDDRAQRRRSEAGSCCSRSIPPRPRPVTTFLCASPVHWW